MKVLIVRVALVLAIAGLPTSSHADTTSVSTPGIVAIFFLAGTDLISLIANTAEVATNKGSKGMGWVGIGAGGLTMAVGIAASDNSVWAIATGFTVAGMGVWSLRLAGRESRVGPALHSVALGVGVGRRSDGTLEARTTMTLAL